QKVWNGITANNKKSANIKMTAKSYEPDHRRPDWGSMIVDALKFAMQKAQQPLPYFSECRDDTI
ncbi:MAG: hypothetical protein MR279_08370, partial [Bacteroidales bacterium]|nr:hypothetical protein [Bacteroidales bacterium]